MESMDAKNYILLMNRDEKFVKEVSKSLVDAGYSALTASTKSDALNYFSNHHVALVICDSELSDANGFDFLEFLKNSPDLKHIPFVFLISARFVVDTLEEEVSKILKAFEMGAADFIVDTLDEEISKVLVKRIHKLLPATVAEKGKPELSREARPAPSVAKAKAAAPAPDERRDSKRITPKQMVNVEISRDSVLWMPGQITNINEQGIMLETSLLGKLGMLLYIRVHLPGGKFIVTTSHISHISISKNSPTAEIGVEITESVEWIEIYNYVAKLLGIVTKPSAADQAAAGLSAAALADQHAKRHVYVDPHLNDLPDAGGDKGLEIKFYRSLIGKQLGNYRAVSFIGAGNMAGVFKGWDVVLERDVALKVISYKLSAIPSYRDMFVKEARLVSRLIHPNIAQIYHIDQMDDLFYFVMELISGGTLADVIKDRSKLNLAKGLEHFITTCRTLDFVSKQNIVHRDIKPANIMINDRGVLKVLDFGVAVVNDETNQIKNPEGFGAPLYASPECILGRPLDLCSDIYSLGATFYHVFAGEPPFDGETVEIINHKHLNEHLVPLRKRNPMASSDLSDIISKMMAKKPQERYQNYRSLINDLIEVVH